MGRMGAEDLARLDGVGLSHHVPIFSGLRPACFRGRLAPTAPDTSSRATPFRGICLGVGPDVAVCRTAYQRCRMIRREENGVLATGFFSVCTSATLVITQ